MVVALIVLVVLLALVLFLICPAFRRHKDREILTGMHIAHRGLHDLSENTPENSLAAFSEAIKYGFCIENDIHITVDGEVVVFHDDTLTRMCGVDKKIEDCTLAELKTYRLADTDECIPTLQECLDLVNGQVPLMIEFKALSFKTAERLCVAANEILKDYKGKYFVQSFFPPVIGWYKKNRKDICRGQLAAPFKGEKLKNRLLGLMLFNFLSRPDFISYDYNGRKNIMRRVVIALGAFPVAWTFTKQADIDECKKDFKTYIFEGFIPKK